VPEDLTFHTKPQLAVELVRDSHQEAMLAFKSLVADCLYSGFHLDVWHMQLASARPRRETEVDLLHLIGNRSRGTVPNVWKPQSHARESSLWCRFYPSPAVGSRDP
jgi:hypothetical protein